VTWVRGLIRLRRSPRDAAAPENLPALELGIAEAVSSGTALVGDISNTLVTFAPLARSPLAALVFYELLQLTSPDPERFVEQACHEIDNLVPTDSVRVSLGAHAPYSVGPLVFRAIRRAIDRRPFLPASVHLSESAEEVEFIRTGGGPWRAFLEELGAWNGSWVPPGVSPVQYLDDNGFLKGRVVVVHGVQMSKDDLARLARLGITLVTCPRSNVYTGAGRPPLVDFYASGVRVAVGTDSLASAPDLNVFSELRVMRELAPAVPAATLLESATLEGARALGFESEFGSIEPGKRARLLAVDVPAGEGDVEEYLMSGIDPEQVRWAG
jgi:cytosine/adenosine deaminase-related metal-dependent hydrolase